MTTVENTKLETKEVTLIVTYKFKGQKFELINPTMEHVKRLHVHGHDIEATCFENGQVVWSRKVQY